MAKLGRYSADRKKIEALTATTVKALDVADCGTVFTCPGGNGVSTLTLPKISAAGKGWWAKFILLANNGTGDVTIQPNAANDASMIVCLLGGLDKADATANVASEAAAKTVFFDASGALAGDQIEVICTGEKWVVQAISAGNATDIQVTS
tara:strand:- start:446 stop:895 length:450 start_codon:yes stop_codon:yes gene_type:complete